MDKELLKKNKFIFPFSLIVTMIGNITFNFSTNLYLLEKTEKGIILATNISFSILPVIIFAPILGKVIDKFIHKKLIILFGNFLNLLLMLLMILFWNKLNNTYLIYFGILFNNFFSFLVYLTFEASIPQLFPKDWLIKANSLSSSIDSISGVLSPLLGGFIYSILEIQAILKLNIIFIYIVILINTFLSFRKKNIINDNFEAHSNLNTTSKNKKILKLVVITGIIFNIGFGLTFSVTIPYIINKVFQVNSEIYGIIQSCFYLGMMFGASFFAIKVKEITINYFYKIFLYLGLILTLFLFPLIIKVNLICNIFFYILAMIFYGMQSSYFDICLTSFVQREISENDLGKYLGIFISFSKVFLLISIFISGIIIDFISYKIIFFVSIILFISTSKYLKTLNDNNFI